MARYNLFFLAAALVVVVAPAVANTQPIVVTSGAAVATYGSTSCAGRVAALMRDVRALDVRCAHPSVLAAAQAALLRRFATLDADCHAEVSAAARQWIALIQTREWRDAYCNGRVVQTPGGSVTPPGRTRRGATTGSAHTSPPRVVCEAAFHATRGPDGRCDCGDILLPDGTATPRFPVRVYGMDGIHVGCAVPTAGGVLAVSDALAATVREHDRRIRELERQTREGTPYDRTQDTRIGEIGDRVRSLEAAPPPTGAPHEIIRERTTVVHESDTPWSDHVAIGPRLRLIVPTGDGPTTFAAMAEFRGTLTLGSQTDLYGRFGFGAATSGRGIGTTMYWEAAAGFTQYTSRDRAFGLSLGIFGYDVVDPSPHHRWEVQGDTRRWGIGGEFGVDVRLTDEDSTVEVRLQAGVAVTYDRSFTVRNGQFIVGGGAAIAPSLGLDITFHRRGHRRRHR